jgi:hypothetical protein
MADSGAPSLVKRFEGVRAFTEALARPLSPEDCGLQSMPDASPTKWHLAHTTWFFETLVLGPAGEPPYDPAFGYLFNSYYEAIGPRHARPRRGMLSRPSLAEVLAYRADVDRRVLALLGRGPLSERMRFLVELGLHHEQQHQELILTDIQHALFENPLRPAYRAQTSPPPSPFRERGAGGMDVRQDRLASSVSAWSKQTAKLFTNGRASGTVACSACSLRPRRCEVRRVG